MLAQVCHSISLVDELDEQLDFTIITAASVTSVSKNL